MTLIFKPRSNLTQSAAPAKQRRRISLRLLLVVSLGVQTVGAVGIVGWLSFRNGHKAIHSLAVRLQTEVNNRVVEHLNVYLTVPVQINQTNFDAIDLGLLDINNSERLAQHFLRQMRLFKQISYINFGSETGTLTGVGRLGKNQLRIEQFDRAVGARIRVYAVTPQDERGKQIDVNWVDPLIERWYTDAINAGKPVWSEIYQWIGETDVVSISYSYPVYDRQQQLLGVLGTDLELSDISDFLKSLHTSRSGRVFIIERNGLLVASSDGQSPFVPGVEAKRLQALESQDSLIRAAADYAIHQFGLEHIQTPQLLEFQTEGHDHVFARVTPWRDQDGLDWLVFVVTPEADFMGQINANTRQTLILSLLALFGSLLSGVFTAQRILRPVRHLNQAAERISQGDLSSHSLATSHVTELDVLSQSFDRMAQQLRDSFRALERVNYQLELNNQDLENRVQARTEELSQALRDLQKAQAQLVQTEKMSSLGQMVAGIAHEINNPITFIHGNLSYACEYISDLLETLALYQKHYPAPTAEIQQQTQAVDLEFLVADLPKLLNSMNEGTRRIREIVLSLRNFSRLDESAMKLVDIHEGIDSTLLLLEHRLEATSFRPAIQVVRHYGALPLVECFAGQLNQVFMNILINAIDAIDERYRPSSSQLCYPPSTENSSSQRPPDQITLSTAVEQDVAIVRIADSGVGMTADIQAKLFDPFFTTKSVGQGTGLGLSVSYQIIVGQHRGQLRCHSVVGTGSEFVIEIPIQLPIRSSHTGQIAQT